MIFKILSAVILAAPLYLIPTVKAENTVPLRQSAAVESSHRIAQSDWSEFSSTTGGFAVSMPGQPEEETETAEDGSQDHSFSLTLDKSAYFIHYTDIPNAPDSKSEELKNFLDVMTADFVNSAEAKLDEDPRNIEINGYPGKEFKFTLQNGVPGVGRVYMVKERLYLILAMTTDKPEDTQRFVNSFRLL